ncbi:MAG: methyltransferase domain-containing protein [Pseudomonadota bacterium]
MADKKPDLQSAYALSSPEDNRKLYAEWAESYDQSFATDEDYQLHIRTAQAFVSAGGQGPVLDVGAGTGLCGEVLAELGVGPIDACDISAEMLDQAMHKDIYRDAIVSDLNDGIPVPRASYSGLVSSGMFTHGHVGPTVLPGLLRVARRGALCALSINAEHFANQGFEQALRELDVDRVGSVTITDVRIYGNKATGPHRDDIARIVVFEVF